jgi:hypothetical protein
MLWWQYVFAFWVLAHMVWAAVSLEREWQRVRSPDDPARQQRLKNMPRASQRRSASGRHRKMIMVVALHQD